MTDKAFCGCYELIIYLKSSGRGLQWFLPEEDQVSRSSDLSNLFLKDTFTGESSLILLHFRGLVFYLLFFVVFFNLLD